MKQRQSGNLLKNEIQFQFTYCHCEERSYEATASASQKYLPINKNPRKLKFTGIFSVRRAQDRT